MKIPTLKPLHEVLGFMPPEYKNNPPKEENRGLSPIVHEYQLTQSLPDKLQTSLPTVEEIEAELAGDLK